MSPSAEAGDDYLFSYCVFLAGAGATAGNALRCERLPPSASRRVPAIGAGFRRSNQLCDTEAGGWRARKGDGAVSLAMAYSPSVARRGKRHCACFLVHLPGC